MDMSDMKQKYIQNEPKFNDSHVHPLIAERHGMEMDGHEIDMNYLLIVIMMKFSILITPGFIPGLPCHKTKSNTVKKQTVAKYQNSILFLALTTHDQDGKVIQYSATYAQDN